jgi:hypothetical protein
MKRGRKASIILSVPAVLMLICWITAYCYPPFGLSEPLTPYLMALEYLSYAGAALAIALFIAAHRSRDAIICLVINLIVATLNIFGDRLLMSRAIPYIRF